VSKLYTNLLVITLAGLGAMFQGLALFGRITWTQAAGWMAVSSAASGVLSAVNGWTGNVYLCTGIAAWMAWLWWNGGGGDGPRRRLKRWARRFQGVRRTAPQGAS